MSAEPCIGSFPLHSDIDGQGGNGARKYCGSRLVNKLRGIALVGLPKEGEQQKGWAEFPKHLYVSIVLSISIKQLKSLSYLYHSFFFPVDSMNHVINHVSFHWLPGSSKTKIWLVGTRLKSLHLEG